MFFFQLLCELTISTISSRRLAAAVRTDKSILLGTDDYYLLNSRSQREKFGCSPLQEQQIDIKCS